MFDERDYVSEPTIADILCRNCCHTLRDHGPDGVACNAEVDTDADEFCTCTSYEPWDSQAGLHVNIFLEIDFAAFGFEAADS